MASNTTVNANSVNTKNLHVNGLLSGGNVKVLRQSRELKGSAYSLGVNQSGSLIILDEDANLTITLPLITSNDVGTTFTVVTPTVTTGEKHRIITTGHANDLFVGGVTNLPVAVEAGAELYVKTHADTRNITFSDTTVNNAGTAGSFVTCTAILAGNTSGTSSNTLVWSVSGIMGTDDPNGTGVSGDAADGIFTNA